jgi:asparagine synthase (glutamine-hydrolysing)
MCGLVSVVGVDGAAVDRVTVSRMSRSLRHRGPDDEGTYVHRSVGLGFRRLSILDLSPAGHQPMSSSCGEFVIVFNGEIYNYLELRDELESLGHRFRSRGDTEVLLYSYLQWGRDCLERLNGMWAFVIHDRRRNVLFGSRDRFGKKPLYRYQTNGHVLIASEIKAILASGHYRGGVNWNSASRFFLEDDFFEHEDMGGETFYTGISQIPAASAFELDLHGNWKEWRYWDIEDAVDGSVKDPAESFYALFEDAVRLRLRSDVPVGIFLSGGLDSTSIACAVARLRKADGHATAPLLAFSYQAKEYDESTYINDTVRETGIELIACQPDAHQLWETLERVLQYQDEPVHSIVAVITFELSRLAAAHGVKVILNGGGPDEFLGYPHFARDYWRELVRSGRLAKAWREVSAYHDAHGGSTWKDFSGTLAAQLTALIRRAPGGQQLANWKHARKRRSSSWFTADLMSRLRGDGAPSGGMPGSVLHHAVQVAPLPYYLRLEDRNSMAHSIEARMPFLDYRLVSLAFSLPAEWKVRGPWNKYVLRAAMRNRIPESARTRLDKMGFPVPAKAWFGDVLYGPMQDLLSTRELSERGIYRPDAIRRDLERHRAGEIDVSRQLFKLFEFEVWSRNRPESCVAAVEDSPLSPEKESISTALP